MLTLYNGNKFDSSVNHSNDEADIYSSIAITLLRAYDLPMCNSRNYHLPLTAFFMNVQLKTKLSPKKVPFFTLHTEFLVELPLDQANKLKIFFLLITSSKAKNSLHLPFCDPVSNCQVNYFSNFLSLHFKSNKCNKYKNSSH